MTWWQWMFHILAGYVHPDTEFDECLTEPCTQARAAILLATGAES